MQAELIDRFQADTAATRSADTNTARTYRWGAQKLRDFLVAKKLDLARLTVADFDAFARWLAQRKHDDGRPFSPRSVRTGVKSARAFMRWAARNSLAPDLKLDEAPLPAMPKERPRSLDQAGLTQYLAALQKVEEPYRTILGLLPLTGCRVREVCSAPTAGVTRVDGVPVMHVRRKGSPLPFAEIAKYTTAQCVASMDAVPLSESAWNALRGYLAGYRRTTGASPWVFPALTDLQAFVSPDSIRKVLAKVRGELGLPWLTTHKAGRHTLAMILADQDVPLEQIADVLGHKSLETTRNFYAHARPAKRAALAERALETTDGRKPRS